MTRDKLKRIVEDIKHLTTCESLSQDGYRNVLTIIKKKLGVEELEKKIELLEKEAREAEVYITLKGI